MKSLLAILTLLLPSMCAAEVVDSAAAGFTVRTALTIKAAPEEVYSRTIRVGDWWNSSHTFSGDARNLSIDPKPMGCFCERLPQQGGVQHMYVVFLAPGKNLRLVGGLGPLQGVPGNGALTFTYSPVAEGTRLEVVYTFSGYAPQGLSTWAPQVDAVIAEQIARLKTYVETGNPVPAAAK